MMLWDVHQPNGERRGPVSTEELVAGLQRGTLSGQAWVRRAEEPGWRPLASIEAFSDFCEPEEGPEPDPRHTRTRYVAALGCALFALLVGFAVF